MLLGAALSGGDAMSLAKRMVEHESNREQIPRVA
jgi:hypothetical protein